MGDYMRRREPQLFPNDLRLSWHYQGSLGNVRPPEEGSTEAHARQDAKRAAARYARRLILKTLTGGPRHGYAIAKFIEDASAGTVTVEEGSLYPALYRMERRSWLEAEWGESELGRRAKLYRLTRQGRAQLVAETEIWRLFTAGVSKILLAQ